MKFKPSKQDLYFLPLGGVGEIGMNMALYGHGGKWLMVDMGVSFGDDTMPMIEVVMADPAWIADRAKDLAGIVLTHAHEDHLGAVQYLWPRLKCPIWATPFTAKLLHGKLHEAGLSDVVPVNEVPLGGRFTVGPFDVEYISVTHSIPEPNSLAIRTPVGSILHTGDWKFDPDPLICDQADTDALRRFGNDGVLALIGDSTNVFNEGHAGSEATVRANLIELIGRYRGKVAVACFATNVARVESIALAAHANGRCVALVGRSLDRITKAARATGYLSGLPPFLTDHDAAYIPDDEVLYLCTGSQGEPRAALARIANDEHPHLTMGKGDTVIFSSRVIPGNEKAIYKIQNRLAGLGVEIVTDRDEDIHVSGHPARGEMRRMYDLVRPAIAIPVHGETRHLLEHADLALSCGVPKALSIENGQMVRLSPEGPEVVDHVPTGRLGLDGRDGDGYRLLPLDGEHLKERRRMVFNGAAVVTVVLDRQGKLLGAPQLSAPGLVDEALDEDLHDDLIDAIREAVLGLTATAARDDGVVREAVRVATRRGLAGVTGRKPVTQVHLVRV